jgi:membrane protein required for colicin V production
VDEIRSVDVVVAAILGVALLRGLFLGLIREAFSLAALGGACIVVRIYHAPAADWLVGASRGEVGPEAAPWIAGAALGAGTIAAVAIAGRLVRKGVRAAGLGWADRAGGAVLGAAEGALAAGVLLLVVGATLGRDHPFVAGSRSIAALDRIERIADERDLGRIDVAAPPRGRLVPGGAP